jgi:hypothetical protein
VVSATDQEIEKSGKYPTKSRRAIIIITISNIMLATNIIRILSLDTIELVYFLMHSSSK